MRISTAYQYETYSRQIRTASERLHQAHTLVTTGKRINMPSDDPYGTGYVLSARALKSATEQYSANLRQAKDYLTFTTSALDEAHSLLREAYQLAVRANNSTIDQDTRDGMASQVAQMQSRLIEIANTRGAGGQYIFAGQMTTTKPFQDYGSFVFAGDNNDIRVETSAGETMVVNTPGEVLFRQAYDSLVEFQKNLQSGASGVIEADIGALQGRMREFRTEWARAGAKVARVDEIALGHQRRVDELTVRISDVEDVDMSDAILQYKQAEMALTAALQVGSRGFQPSLMDFIR